MLQKYALCSVRDEDVAGALEVGVEELESLQGEGGGDVSEGEYVDADACRDS
jgi:hypothetical protein